MCEDQANLKQSAYEASMKNKEPGPNPYANDCYGTVGASKYSHEEYQRQQLLNKFTAIDQALDTPRFTEAQHKQVEKIKSAASVLMKVIVENCPSGIFTRAAVAGILESVNQAKNSIAYGVSVVELL